MNRPILKNKLYLYLTEFFAGMSVMAVELGASRLLAPYFSSSQIVWTIIIGTIMIAMALGNLYGGRMADKDPNPDKLYKRIIIAAIWIAAIPVVGKYIIIGISALLIFTVSIALFLVCCLLGHSNSFAFWQTDLTYEGESIYNYLQVYENDKQVVLSTNVLFGTQSVYAKEKGPTGYYYDHAMAAVYMGRNDKKDTPTKILILGNGSGTYATQCERYFDNVEITGVEIDEKITSLAHKYFELPKDVPVVTYDGRAYLNVIDDKYDIIMVDAYQDITIPFQMSSVEFFTLVKNHLTDNGVMVVNLNMRSDEKNNINYYLADTIGQVFPYIMTSNVQNNTNRILFASMNDDMEQKLATGVAAETDDDLIYMMSKVQENLTSYQPGDLILTDDKAPVELLGMQIIDELIAGEVGYYKDIYKTQGLEGLINML